jgi:tellurite resistance protein TerC
VDPLILSITAIAVANFVFALDSMPAIFGLTRDTFVILAANGLALLGLRQLFFVIDRLLERLPLLNYGLALILAFIGLKLVDEGLIQSGITRLGSWELPEIGIGPSLTVIASVLVLATGLGLLVSRRPNDGVSQPD